jgi:nitroreductase
MLADFSRSTLERILSAAILAPSADNHHLFRFAILADRIVMKKDEAFRSSHAQTRLLAHISLGAAGENIALQASCFGKKVDIDWLETGDAICEIRLVDSDDPPDRLADAIALRHTNRRFFRGPPLAPAEQADLEREVEQVPNVCLVWLDRPVERRKALRLIRLAEAERFRSPALHAELFSSLRFDVGPRSSCEQGIPIGAAEIELFARPFFRLLRRWPVMRALNVLHAHALLGLRAAYFPARLSPHLGVVVAHGDMPHAAISAGRALQRFWLRATQLGMAFQPFAAAALYARPEFTSVSPHTRAALQAGWAELVPLGVPLMAFRLGHSDAPSVRAGRPALAHFLQP